MKIRRSFAIFCFLCLLVITTRLYYYYFWSNESQSELALSYHRESISSFLARKRTEFSYKKLLASLTIEALEKLEKDYFRNISYHYSRELLPPSLPQPSEQCLLSFQRRYETNVSIVIVYHNELLPLLLRTLTIIMRRTRPEYLNEIILIDDSSPVDFSGDLLTYCRSHKIPVVYMRNTQQMGIARSRLKGITMATGKVTVLLDSHIEVMDLWLEPLLRTIEYHPNGIVVPCMKLLQEAQPNSECKPYEAYPRYGFRFIEIKNFPTSYFYDQSDNFKSSALLGGSFAGNTDILRKFYPISLVGNTWSVENSRLSFRIWLCGDGIRVSSCSQVMHRNGLDVLLTRYLGNDNTNLFSKLLVENVAEILNFIPDTDSDDKQVLLEKAFNDDIYKSLALQYSDQIRKSFNPQTLSCKNYSYYLRNVMKYFQSFQKPDFVFVGGIESVSEQGKCIEIGPKFDSTLFLYSCRDRQYTVDDSHVFGFTKNGGIRIPTKEDKCLDLGNFTDKVFAYPCHTKSPTLGSHAPSQNIIFDKMTLQIKSSNNHCFEVNGKDIMVSPCNEGKLEQKWKLRPASWFS